MPQQKVHISRIKKIAPVATIFRANAVGYFHVRSSGCTATKIPIVSGYWAIAMNDVPEVTLSGSGSFRSLISTCRRDLLARGGLHEHEPGRQPAFSTNSGFSAEITVRTLRHGLRMPLVTTLHTVIQSPSAGQMVVTRRIANI